MIELQFGIYMTYVPEKGYIGKQRALSLGIWPIPNIDSVIGYYCVQTTVVACDYSVLSTGFNTCPPYSKVYV